MQIRKIQKLILIFTLTVFLSQGLLYAQDKSVKDDEVKSNNFSTDQNVNIEKNSNELNSKILNKKFAIGIYPLLSLLMLDVDIFYLSAEIEYSFSNYFSFPVAVRSLGFDGSYFTMISPGLRLYPEGEGMKGLFLSMYYEGALFFSNTELKDRNYYYLNNPKEIIVSTLWAGYRWAYSDFYLELGTGIFYMHFKDVYKNDEYTFKDFVFWSGISFGGGCMF